MTQTTQDEEAAMKTQTKKPTTTATAARLDPMGNKTRRRRGTATKTPQAGLITPASAAAVAEARFVLAWLARPDSQRAAFSVPVLLLNNKR